MYILFNLEDIIEPWGTLACISVGVDWLIFFLRPTVSRPVRLDVGHPFDVHDQILIFLCLAFTFLSSSCRAPSLTRGWVCSLQWNHSVFRVAQNPQTHFAVSSETPPTRRTRSPYLSLPGTGWPSYIPGHWVPLLLRLPNRRATVEVFYPASTRDK
jgi:hypothetical protein